ncbi:MAG TPA: CPXCG motif-containing cysteine-rich protein [Gemmatimonadales bacterium]|nr:CPXCG motif-containing cysteine-rich protein [Gemmatimonadales bacterium]
MGDDEYLYDDYPTGEGAADEEAVVNCPYCGEVVVIALDPGGGGEQHYVEDCPVCCRPWQVSLHYDEEGRAEIALGTEE